MSDAIAGGGKSNRRGAPPPDIVDLVRVEDRISFLYFEHCKINRADNAITVRDGEGTVYVPSATLSVLMLGPGASMTHDAMTMLGECGVTVVWVGERGIRMYAFGKPLTHSSGLLQVQARLVSNTRTRLAVARRMYGMRFPGESVGHLTMGQLRGREGVRVRRVYKEWSEITGVEWSRRTYNPDDFDDATEINKALSAAHVCLYALAHSAIVALGCSPGLGFVHTGHERSFVYDIADLYKAEISIPVAFQTAAEKPMDIGVETRRKMRNAVYGLSILPRMVTDIKSLLLGEIPAEGAADLASEMNHLGLWDEKEGEVAAGRSYAEPEGGGGD
ncbi:MAG: type I-E CRISPR-associated endonuclease Cas1e [Tractidigestivibacter sp.]|uniref:type I-E CRISPR-associated endonuclease Cas1e n=1 Tax=Tractidigestivibacter sp. TaxID=2847320 RepID=UPI002A817CE4|nr:type I-E CRISPR-associated endonuclease Cas1e [Tractidigestivibacter sp.]MDY4533682.1 type I-E CRISPR-associated endonuclease Cas1e [Tractidigestivibacter sp.]